MSIPLLFLVLFLSSSISATHALSVSKIASRFASATTGRSGDNKNGNGNGNIRIELFDPNDEKRLRSLRECRRTSFPASKANFLNSERDFIAAKKAVEGTNLCAVAIRGGNGNGNDIDIVGSADLTPRPKSTGYQNTITNVFVRPDFRGRGIGRLLMEEGVERVLAENLPETHKQRVSGDADAPTTAATATLSLDVYTQNTPAIKLYQSMGYEPASAVHAGTLKLANTLGTNFVVTLSKTVPLQSE